MNLIACIIKQPRSKKRCFTTNYVDIHQQECDVNQQKKWVSHFLIGDSITNNWWFTNEKLDWTIHMMGIFTIKGWEWMDITFPATFSTGQILQCDMPRNSSGPRHTWWLFDDCSVQIASESKVLQMMSPKNGWLILVDSCDQKSWTIFIHFHPFSGFVRGFSPPPVVGSPATEDLFAALRAAFPKIDET